jgi:two-component system response regulator DctR
MIRVLLVDDEPDLGDMIARILEDEDISSVHALSAESALAILDGGEQFDCLLVDVTMPGMGGLELIERLRSRPGFISKIVLMTGHVRLPKHDADAVLEKPFHVAPLLDVIGVRRAA